MFLEPEKHKVNVIRTIPSTAHGSYSMDFRQSGYQILSTLPVGTPRRFDSGDSEKLSEARSQIKRYTFVA